MRGIRSVVGATVLACALVLVTAAAASAAGYMKLGDIKGESASVDHPGYMDITSFSWGVEGSSASPGARHARPAAPMPVVFRKQVDTSSPQLFFAAASGRVFDCATLAVRENAEGPDTSVVTFEDVTVMSYSTGVQDTDALEDRVSFTYKRILYNHGDTTRGWDFLSHSPFEKRCSDAPTLR